MAGGVEAAREQKFIETSEKKAIDKKEEELAEGRPASPAATKASPKADAKGAAKAKPADSKPVAPAKPAEKKEEKKKREIIMERIYIVPLADAYAKPAMKRSNKAILLLRQYIARHMKSADEDLKIALELNNAVRGPSSARPLKKVKVKATKDKTGAVLAELAA